MNFLFWSHLQLLINIMCPASSLLLWLTVGQSLMAVQPGRGHRLKKTFYWHVLLHLDVVSSMFLLLCVQKRSSVMALVFVLLELLDGLEFRLQVFEVFISVWRASCLSFHQFKFLQCFPACFSFSLIFMPLSSCLVCVFLFPCLLCFPLDCFLYSYLIGGSVHVCITFLWLLPLLFTFVFFHVLC